MVVPRVETALHGVETPTSPAEPIADWLGLENKASATRRRQGPIAGSEIPPCIYNSDNLGTKTVIPRVETAPNNVETPVPLADR